MPWLLNVKPLSGVLYKIYIGDTYGVIPIGIAFSIEPCLRTFGLELNLASDESVDLPDGGTVRGVRLEYAKRGTTEDSVREAVDVCVRYELGVRPERVELAGRKKEEELYQLKAAQPKKVEEGGRFEEL